MGPHVLRPPSSPSFHLHRPESGHLPPSKKPAAAASASPPSRSPHAAHSQLGVPRRCSPRGLPPRCSLYTASRPRRGSPRRSPPRRWLCTASRLLAASRMPLARGRTPLACGRAPHAVGRRATRCSATRSMLRLARAACSAPPCWATARRARPAPSSALAMAWRDGDAQCRVWIRVLPIWSTGSGGSCPPTPAPHRRSRAQHVRSHTAPLDEVLYACLELDGRRRRGPVQVRWRGG